MILLDKQLPITPAEIVEYNEAISIIGKLEYELKHSKISGIGLAAPQIGINKAVAIIRIPASVDNDVVNIDLINPKLIAGDDFVFFNEGCLSFPNMAVKTIRFGQVSIQTLCNYNNKSNMLNNGRYNVNPNMLDSYLEEKIIIVDEITSIVCQHEMAHLTGLTMFDFAPNEAGRNDMCPCNSGKKNKKCHNYKFYNKNLEKLFNPNYRSV